MKKILVLTIPAIFLLSCNQTKSNAEATHSIDNSAAAADTVSKTVKLSVQPETFKLSALPDSIMVIMTNNTADTITTGLHYHIEKLQADEWKEVSPKDIAFIDIGWRLKPYDTERFGKKLYKDKIHYKSGKYRIAKYYLKSDYHHTKKTFNVYAEFTVD